MKLKYTIIYVTDVIRTINFYQKAFGLEVLFVHESKQYGELKTGETTLAFASEGLVISNGVQFKRNFIRFAHLSTITKLIDNSHCRIRVSR